jgi:nicotinamidase-related amidase
MKFLIVVDMQVDFTTGSLGSPHTAAIIPHVVDLVKGFDGKVIFTRDTHGENYLQTQEGKYLPVPHCIRGTEGWQIRPDIKELLTGAEIIEKPVFGSIALAAGLKDLSKKEKIELELIGLCTDICVVSNALLLKSAIPEVKITVDAACCAGVTPETHKAALTTMKMCQVKVIEE